MHDLRINMEINTECSSRKCLTSGVRVYMSLSVHTTCKEAEEKDYGEAKGEKAKRRAR